MPDLEDQGSQLIETIGDLVDIAAEVPPAEGFDGLDKTATEVFFRDWPTVRSWATRSTSGSRTTSVARRCPTRTRRAPRPATSTETPLGHSAVPGPRRLTQPGWLGVMLAMIAGYVDAIGFTRLFEVFPANQSGNAVLLGVAIGDPSWNQGWRPGLSIAMFMVGVAIGVVLGAHLPASRRARRAARGCGGPAHRVRGGGR